MIQGSDRIEGDMWYVFEAGRIQNTFNPNGTLSKTIYNDGLFVKDYAYDGFNLASLSYKRADQSVIGSFQYGYDNNRNIVSRSENGQTSSFTYDALQRIHTSSQYNETYGYDERGNRKTLVSDLSPTVPLNSYEYDDRDRLIKVVASDGHEVRYRYNGDGLLYERLENGVTTRYYYDEQGNLFREGTVMPDGSVQLTARYIYGGAGGSPLARDDVASDVVLYYVNNGHGDVAAVVDGAGNLVNRYQYDIWGNPLETTESMSTPFRYSGEYWDDSTGLQYLRARWYDPSVGRFINEDSYEGSLNNPLTLNLYTYVHNNPLKNVDPTGHWCTSANGKWAHPGNPDDCSPGSIYSADFENDGNNILSNGNEIGTFYDNDGVHEDDSWTGVLFDVVVTGGLGIGKAVLSKTITKLFGRAVSKEAAASVSSGLFYGGRAGEAALANLVGATAKNQLQQGFSTSLGRRIIDVLVDGVAYESKVGYVKYSQVAVNQIMKDAELIAKGRIDGAVWHFFKSGITKEVGVDQRLLDMMTKNGIKYVIHN